MADLELYQEFVVSSFPSVTFDFAPTALTYSFKSTQTYIFSVVYVSLLAVLY